MLNSAFSDQAKVDAYRADISLVTVLPVFPDKSVAESLNLRSGCPLMLRKALSMVVMVLILVRA